MKSLYDEGQVVIIYGDKGSGKTSLALVLGYIGQVQGQTILLNIENNIPGFHLISTDVDLLEAFLKYKKSMTFIMDESNIIQDAHRPSGDVALNLYAFVSVVRKFRMSFWMIIQREANILLTIRDLTDIEIHKTSPTEGEMTIGPLVIPFNNVPGTTDFKLEYDTYSFAGFRFLLEWPKILNALTGMSYDRAIKTLIEMDNNNFDGYRLDERGPAPPPKKRKVDVFK